MIYCVFDYKGGDRIVTCDEPNQAYIILARVEEVKERKGCSSLGFINGADMTIQLYPDPNGINLTARIKKAVDDYYSL